MISILFFCHGNICRSPMAESIFSHLVQTSGLDSQFFVSSAATSSEEIGNPPYPAAVRQLQRRGVPVVPHRAVRLRREDYDRYDLLLAMDSENLRGILRITGQDPEDKVRRLLDLSSRPRDIADPWYSGDFETAYRDILEGCTALLARFIDQQPGRDPHSS